MATAATDLNLPDLVIEAYGTVTPPPSEPTVVDNEEGN